MGATLLGSTIRGLIREPHHPVHRRSRDLGRVCLSKDPQGWGSPPTGMGDNPPPHRRVCSSGACIKRQAPREDGFVLKLIDITARKNAEDALREANARLNMLGRLIRNDLMAAVFGLLSRIAEGTRQFDDPPFATSQ